MKDTKVFVDLDDEITFITEKIINTDTNRVILVVPERSDIITSLVGLKMLRKVIDKNDKDVVIVTMDEQGKNIALNAGFISVSKIGDVNEEVWRETVRIKKRIHDAMSMSNKVPFKDELYKSVDNREETKKAQQEKFFEYKPEENTPIPLNSTTESVDNKKINPDKRGNIKRVEFNKEPISSSKKVSLDGFELIAGGDVASFKDTENIDKNINPDRSKAPFENNEFKRDINKTNKFKSIFFKDNNKNKRFNKLIIFLGIFILLIIFIIYYLFLTVSTVSITMSGKKIQSQSTITINPNISSINGHKLEIPSKIVSISESGSNSIPTTGTKTIQTGSFASGSITFSNTSTSAVTIPASTQFTDSNNISFVTTSSIKVPAATVTRTTTSQTINYGTATQNETLNTNTGIGANDTFSNSNYSSITATNPSAFSQGNESTSTQQVVTANDANNLQSTLSQELFARGKGKLSSSGNMKIIQQSIKNIIVNKNFDHTIGSVASVLNLSMNTKTVAQEYNSNNIYSAIVKNQEYYGNTINNVKFSITRIYTDSSGNIKISINYTGILFKNINKNNILNTIKGKSFSSAKNYIQGMKNINKVSIQDNPYIFSIIGLLPSNKNNIKIKVLN